jgi:hypothetical protein
MNTDEKTPGFIGVHRWPMMFCLVPKESSSSSPDPERRIGARRAKFRAWNFLFARG